MPAIQPCPLPEGALLDRYRQSGAYTDCYTTQVSRAVSQAQYVEAFYTGTLFKLERHLLAWFAAHPSTDAQAAALARGARETFAAWRVEARTDNQLLMCDLTGRTRSWLMSEPAGGSNTRLYFGSAVVPAEGTQEISGFPFSALLGFHKLYSRALLAAAGSRLVS